MIKAMIRKNDRRAGWIIGLLSFTVFGAVLFLSRVQVPPPVSFDVHVFARINALLNTTVSILLPAGLVAIRKNNQALHRKLMFTAMILSALFLVSYCCHHLFAGDTKFGGTGWIRPVYFFILVTHILLASCILPFILFTAYRALVAEFPAHRKLAKITWPVWLYVSVSGVLVYLLISPYYTV